MKRFLSFFLLFLLPLFLINAHPQSFYFSSGQTIENGDIVRGYCLEYTKDSLNMKNISDLTRIIGNVWVTYKNGNRILTTLQELKNSGNISFQAFNSYQYLRFIFNNNDISEITIGDDGITLFRKKMEKYEEELANQNIQRIRELESQNVNHSLIQKECWKRWNSVRTINGDTATIYFPATDPDKQVQIRFGDSSTVSHERNGNIFLRTDGILNSTEIFNEGITELTTHPHDDHISKRALETLLKKGDFKRIISNYPFLDSSNIKILEIINSVKENHVYEFKQKNGILEIPSLKNELTDFFYCTIGDFYYTAFNYDEDVQVEIFKYQKPIKNNVNSDGAIYQITINKVTFLLFGDFDYPKGIENLLNASIANKIKRAEIEEEIADLCVDLYEAYDTVNDLENQIDKAIEQNLNILQLSEQYKEAVVNYSEIEEDINELRGELYFYPVVKADVIKYPHHAHVFDKKNWGLINRLNEILNPEHIIYQTRNIKNVKKFNEFLKSLSPELQEKMIDSAKFHIKVITLKQYKRTFNSFISNEGEAA